MFGFICPTSEAEAMTALVEKALKARGIKVAGPFKFEGHEFMMLARGQGNGMHLECHWRNGAPPPAVLDRLWLKLKEGGEDIGLAVMRADGNA